MAKVILTGVTGFLGSHIAIQLLNKGYEVLGTLRDMKRAESIRKAIGSHTSNLEKLTFAEADLLDHDCWASLMKGYDYVMHVASPFPRELPKTDDDLVIPAKKGTLNILEAALKNRIKRVVLTSSTAAIIYGKDKDQRKRTFNEEDWTNPENKKDTSPYFRSKAIAEKAAWDFMHENAGSTELSVICPGAILGPVLEEDFGTSANIVIKILDGSTPAIPNIGFDMVDVRSVAALHILAMESPAAANQRFIGSSGYLKFKEVADILRKKYPERKIPKMVLPDFVTQLVGSFDKNVKPVLVDLGAERKVDNSKAVKVLGWEPISLDEAVESCAESVLKYVLN